MSYSVPKIAGESDTIVGRTEDHLWARWEVFVRPRGGVTHVYSESVHAPDAETALLNARDTYLRRVEGVSLWVIPSGAISRWDEHQALPESRSEEGSARRLWEAFIRHRRGAQFLHAGSIVAADAVDAIVRARDAFLTKTDGVAIWVAPSEAIVAADPDEAEMLFEPFADKGYRQATYYDIPEEVGYM